MFVHPQKRPRSLKIDELDGQFEIQPYEDPSNEDKERYAVSRLKLWPLQTDEKKDVFTGDLVDADEIKCKEDVVTGEMRRRDALLQLQGANNEFYNLNELSAQLKTKEYIELRQCPGKDIDLSTYVMRPMPASQRVSIVKNELQHVVDSFTNAIDNAQEVLNSRRNYAFDLLEMRRHWRLLLVPNEADAASSASSSNSFPNQVGVGGLGLTGAGVARYP